MTHRKIVLCLNISKDYAYRKRYFSSASAAVRYPLGRDLSSLPLALTEKLPDDPIPCFDDRSVSLRYRVKSMIELSQLDKAVEISRFAGSRKHRDGPKATLLMCKEIIGAMIDAKRNEDAIALFHYFFNECNLIPSIVSINHIIKIHCDENRLDKALQLYHHARDSKKDNKNTYRILTKGFVDAGRIYEAIGLVEAKVLWDSDVYSYLIRSLLDLGNIYKAEELLDELMHNMPNYTYEKVVMVDAEFVDFWFRQGNDENAMEIYRSITTRAPGEFMYATCGNILLRILLKNGKKSEAWALFEGMKSFDSETINIMVNECFKMAKFKEAMDSFKLGASLSPCYRNIIDRFCERGMMSEAEDLFEKMWSHEGLVLSYEVATFRSMINGYVKVGRVVDAKQMLKKMVHASLLKVAISKDDGMETLDQCVEDDGMESLDQWVEDDGMETLDQCVEDDGMKSLDQCVEDDGMETLDQCVEDDGMESLDQCVEDDGMESLDQCVEDDGMESLDQCVPRFFSVIY